MKKFNWISCRKKKIVLLIPYILHFNSVMNAEKENDGSSRGNSNRRGANARVLVTVKTKKIANSVPREKV